LNYFFGTKTIKLKYGHKVPLFYKNILGFQKWTKKMSKIEKPKILSQRFFQSFI